MMLPRNSLAENSTITPSLWEKSPFPIEVADRLLAGENAVRIFRDHCGMTQKQLAGAAGINPLYLSQIERGVRTGSARTLSALAEALGVDVDDLI